MDLTESGDITHPPHPIGIKKSKRQEEEGKIIGYVTVAICGTIAKGDGNNSTAAVVGAALGQFTSLISEAFKSWQNHQSYSNADPALRKTYDVLLLLDNFKNWRRLQQRRRRVIKIFLLLP